jgi:hypothetical protein
LAPHDRFNPSAQHEPFGQGYLLVAKTADGMSHRNAATNKIPFFISSLL